MKVLVATEKPFSKVAVDGIQKIVEGAGYTFAKLEKYASPAELLAAVADADAQALVIAKDLAANQVEVEPTKEIIAMIAYLQRLGTDIKSAPKEETQSAEIDKNN